MSDILIHFETTTRVFDKKTEKPETRLEIKLMYGYGWSLFLDHGWRTTNIELCVWRNWRVFRVFLHETSRHIWLWRYGGKQYKWNKVYDCHQRKDIWKRTELDWDDEEEIEE